LRTVRTKVSDGPRVHHGWSVFLGALLEVRVAISDGPPPTRGQSVWCFPDCLSPFLLELRFHLGFVRDLFLGLVGPLRLRDLGKIVWESLVVDLGHRRVHPSGRIGSHSLPPLWSPNRSFSFFSRPAHAYSSLRTHADTLLDADAHIHTRTHTCPYCDHTHAPYLYEHLGIEILSRRNLEINKVTIGTLLLRGTLLTTDRKTPVKS
jgi:hypothetical protein